MKKTIMYLWPLLVFLFFTACNSRQTVANTGFYEPYRILEVNMPFADNINNAQFDEVWFLEEDSFGRKHYQYTTYSKILGENITIHVISQNIKDGYIYYYPDDCYLLQREEQPALSETELHCFKARNNWNEPYEDHIMHCVSHKNPPKNIVIDEILEIALLNHLRLNENYSVLSNGMEINCNQQMFFVMVFERQDEKDRIQNEKYYLLVYDPNAKSPITAIEEIELSNDIRTIIATFRKTYFAQ